MVAEENNLEMGEATNLWSFPLATSQPPTITVTISQMGSSIYHFVTDTSLVSNDVNEDEAIVPLCLLRTKGFQMHLRIALH